QPAVQSGRRLGRLSTRSSNRDRWNQRTPVSSKTHSGFDPGFNTPTAGGGGAGGIVALAALDRNRARPGPHEDGRMRLPRKLQVAKREENWTMKRGVYETCLRRAPQALLLAALLALSACGGGGSGGKSSAPPPGGGGGGGGGNQQPSSNWDSLTWDQDNWA